MDNRQSGVEEQFSEVSEDGNSSGGEEEPSQFVVQLLVTEEQRAVIEALFGHNDWEYKEVGDREEHGDFDDGVNLPDFVVPQDRNAVECVHCLCRPCITDPRHKQMWWEDEPQPPHDRNSSIRKGLYKRFWTMLYHRQVWQDPRYLQKKCTALQQDRNRIHHVWSGGRLHKRDIMPVCILKLVRGWFPNPDCLDYMGHKWG